MLASSRFVGDAPGSLLLEMNSGLLKDKDVNSTTLIFCHDSAPAR